jgi:hypothetical protein
MSSRLICFLVDCQQHLECCCVDDSAFVSFVVSLEGTERIIEILRTMRGHWRRFSLFSSKLSLDSCFCFSLVISYHNFLVPCSVFSF